MIELNLQTKSPEQEAIKSYLQENASEILADKINNGVHITVDGKPLINRKNLDGFMKFACEEAKKLSEKDAKFACIKSDTVFGWAVHYFEENSIIGSLFYYDGTEYKPEPKSKLKNLALSNIKVKDDSKASCQLSLFDNLEASEEKANDELDNAIKCQVVTEDGEIIDYEDFDGDVEEVIAEEPKPAFNPVGTPLYQKYMYIQKQYPTAILTMRLGDFYVFLGENAKTVANELDLTLTGRDCGLSERVPLCGIPYHAVDNYFNKITKNHDLAVVEDAEDIKFIRKQELQTKTLSADNAQVKRLIEIFGKNLEVK